MEKQTWRFIDMEVKNSLYSLPYIFVMAGLTKATRGRRSPNTFWVASHRGHGITLGRHVNAELYIDYDYCKEHDIDTWLTPLGHGAGFYDRGNITCGITADRKVVKAKTLLELYGEIVPPVAEALSKEYNIEAYYSPLNDIEVKGKKVTGTSFLMTEDLISCPYFFQVKPPDVEAVQRALRTPPEKVADKVTATVVERATCYETVAGREITLEEFKELLKKTFEQMFDIKLVPGELTEDEKAGLRELNEQINNDDWLRQNSDERKLGRIPPDMKRCETAMKVPQGPAIRVVALTKENIIQNISITGSMHAAPPEVPFWMEDALRGVKIDENIIRARLEEVFKRGEVANATAEDYVKVIMGAVAG